ncbi:fluoride efflux transporter CrcB [Ottowia sp.]|uniref:fluoride efflux transporter CrcB n=1 Tax=Ottowia sp. TaxID=1898956 RepID=UPI003A855317
MHAVIAICLGASIGALLRWQLGLWLNHTAAWLPWGTLAANLVGGYLIGLALALLHHHPHIDPVWRLLLVTGFLGALTTFSSFSAEVVEMLLHQRYLPAASTAALHLAGSLLLTWAGIRTVGFWMAQRIS